MTDHASIILKTKIVCYLKTTERLRIQNRVLLQQSIGFFFAAKWQASYFIHFIIGQACRNTVNLNNIFNCNFYCTLICAVTCLTCYYKTIS